MQKDDDIYNDNDTNTVDSDSMHNDEAAATNFEPRRSSCIRKPANRLNLTTWLCYLSALSQILINFKQNQEIILNQQHNYKIYHSTVDNSLNDIHPLIYAIGYAENEVFHLGNMLK